MSVNIMEAAVFYLQKIKQVWQSKSKEELWPKMLKKIYLVISL